MKIAQELRAGNVVMIGLIAFAVIWAMDRVLRRVGLGAWSTSGA